MDIVNHVFSELKLNDMVHPHSIETPSCRIGAHHHWKFPVQEQLQCGLAALHARVLIVRQVLDISLLKHLANAVHSPFRLCEYHNASMSKYIEGPLDYVDE